MTEKGLKTQYVRADFCVVGGGLAGICAAVAAAREGVKTVLVHDRPVLGGNASGEIRMWPCGAQNYAEKETGLFEEIALSSYRYNPDKKYCLWDANLLAFVRREKNLTLFLNCAVFDAATENGVIKSVKGYQTTTQSFVEVQADYFADCSGDSVLAPLSGASFFWGRESKDEYGENMMKTHEKADLMTMGTSCLIQARDVGRKVKFIAPPWAEKTTVEKLKSRGFDIHNPSENYWYIEIGGTENVIDNAEKHAERLISICLGVWDAIKNSGEFDADNFDIDFIGFLPAKRESRRMEGDYVMTAVDIENRVKFADEVAYGGWPLDDHNPLGWDGERANYTVKTNTYGIPYRCLYSKNVSNLFFAGRNISMTHLAMSSARVMGTCSALGQAVGVAASLAVKYSLSPREVGKEKIDELQQILLRNDCYLPDIKRRVMPSCAAACPISALTDGADRNLSENDEATTLAGGESISLDFAEPTAGKYLKIVFDSDILRECFKDMHTTERNLLTRCNTLSSSPTMRVPDSLARDFDVAIEYTDGKRETYREKDNLRRNVLIPLSAPVKKATLSIFSNWGGSEKTRLFAFDLTAV